VLEGLEAVSWAALGHAYGSAEDVPQLLRQVRSATRRSRGRTAWAVLHDRPPGHPVLATALGWSAACGAG